MNKVILIGRLTKDVELKNTQSGVAVCGFSIAVDRKYKAEGQPSADFINCTAWKHTAEFVAKYFRKGNRIALEGRIQTRDWVDDNGEKHYATEVVADSVEFCESKQQSVSAPPPIVAREEAGYFDGVLETPEYPEYQFDASDEGIPF